MDKDVNRDIYGEKYYLTSCEGHQEFLPEHERKLTDKNKGGFNA